MVRLKKKSNFDVIWLIDLDDTLFFSGGKVMSVINSRMTSFIQKELLINFEEANKLRVEYWKKYGATAKGMRKNHGFSFETFLGFSHHLPSFEAFIELKPYIGRILSRLMGRKYLVTNSPKSYAIKVLSRYRLLKYFDGICAFENMLINSEIKCKPSRLLWQCILQETRAKKNHHILVDDTLANLRTAKRLGFRTVWMCEYLRKRRCWNAQHSYRPPYVDFKASTFKQLLRLDAKRR